jgi:hypothetical protein
VTRLSRLAAPFAHPWLLAELFALVNLGALAGDVWLAHSVNSFARAEEWIPVVFSLAAPLLLVAAAIAGGVTPNAHIAAASRRARIGRALGLLVGWLSVAVGIGGMLYHLESHFFEEQTLRNLVYTAPFVAPLAYTGIGLLLILDRTTDPESMAWSQWVVFLAFGGFVGNFVLSLADHAQNGFFNRLEWIPVIVSALGLAFLLIAVVRPTDRKLLRATWAIVALQIATGVAGFALHVVANLHAEGTDLWQKFVFGAPAFAPLLFANLALLAAIGLWPMWRAARTAP